MKNLLIKELRLAMHPTNLIFLALSAMLLIPNYPYYVTFFYTTLGVFFLCLNGRETHDIAYSMCLPVRKRDIVRARIAFVALLEVAQAVVAVPFALLRQSFTAMPGNATGIEPNIAFFGLAFVMMGLFNYAFFTKYYKNPDKVGRAFIFGCTALWLYMIVAEGCVLAIPAVRAALDVNDPVNLGIKLVVLFCGLCIFVLLTLGAKERAEKSFEALDL